MLKGVDNHHSFQIKGFSLNLHWCGPSWQQWLRGDGENACQGRYNSLPWVDKTRTRHRMLEVTVLTTQTENQISGRGWKWALHTDLRLHPWGCTKPQTVDGSSALMWGKMLISSFSFFSLDPNWDSVQRQQYDRLKIDVKSRSWKCLGLFRLVNVLWESRELQT